MKCNGRLVGELAREKRWRAGVDLLNRQR